MKKLKYTSLFNLLKNNYFILVFIIIIVFIIYKKLNLILIIFLILYLIYLCRKSFKLFLFFFIVLILIFINFSLKLYIQKQTFYGNLDEIGKVVQIKKVKDSYQVIFRVGLVKVISYSDEYLECGNKYHIKGKLTKGSTSHYKGGFDYNNYLTYQNIIGILNIEETKYYKKGFSIYQLNNMFDKYFNNVFQTKSSSMIKALTIGNKDELEEKLESSIGSIGISHLFVISGLHINIITKSIKYIFKKMYFKEQSINILTILILIIYFFISGLLISVLRVLINFFLKIINNTFDYKLSNIDIISLNIIIVLLINPFYIYQYSFILSYLISSMIIISSDILIISNKKKFIFSSLKISILSILVTLPIVSNINPDINFLSVIYNMLYIPFITYIMLPMAFITSIVPVLEVMFNGFYIIFENMTNFLSNIKMLTFTFPSVDITIIIIYYLLIYLILKNLEMKKQIYKYLIFLILTLLIWNNINVFSYNDEVYFIDLPKGEATLIKKANNKCNILIDTGEANYDDIILFLKKLGIKRLDLIIITHSDSDHNGMLLEIINSFRVESIYYNKYDNKTKLKIPKFIPHTGLKVNDSIKFKDIELKVLSPSKDYQNSNNNSLVIMANLFGKKYLFTGDISKEVEEKISLSKQDVDILKIAHHGSSTSSSQAFLNRIGFDEENNNKIAICMNGYLNQYSFPNSKTIANIKVPIYITSYTKTICIRKNKILSKYIIYSNW